MGAQDFSVQAATFPSRSLYLTAMALPMKKAAAMKAKKTTSMKAMKGMKVMKAKRVSIIAKGKRAKSAVFRGSKVKTSGGMTKDKLMKNKFGKVVSKAKSAASKKRFAAGGLKAWCDAVKAPQGPEPHSLCCRWRQDGNRQGALCQGQGPAQVKEDLREELLPILGFKCSAPPSWLSRGETVCR